LMPEDKARGGGPRVVNRQSSQGANDLAPVQSRFQPLGDSKNCNPNVCQRAFPLASVVHQACLSRPERRSSLNELK
jgi:hypothetical protein